MFRHAPKAKFMRNMKYAVALFLLLFMEGVYSQTLIDSVIADVKGYPITRSELETELRLAAIITGPLLASPAQEQKKSLTRDVPGGGAANEKKEKRKILDTIITRKFVLLEAAELGIRIPDESTQLTARMAELVSKYATENEFYRVLQRKGIEIETVKEWVLAQLIYNDFFRRTFLNPVTPEATTKLAREYFEKHRYEFKDDAGRQKTYEEVSEELADRFRQQIAKSEFDAWVTQQKIEGAWYIFDSELADIRLEPPQD